MAGEVIPLKVQPGSGLSFPWAEEVTKDGLESTADGSFSFGENNQAIVIRINFEDLGVATQQILGYPTLDVVSHTFMSRISPWKHPLFPWLYASKISRWKGLKFNGMVSGAPAFGTGYGSGPAAQYKYARLTILFTGPNHRVINDTKIVSDWGSFEWWRNVERRPAGGVRTLTQDRNAWQWAETGTGGPTTGVANGIAAPIAQILSAPSEVWVWKDVPESYVYDTKDFPANLAAAVGTVNNAPFPPLNATFTLAAQQWPAGVLLLHPYKITPKTAPILPQLMGLGSTTPARVMDVELPVTIFDPPLGPGATTYGHNTVPFFSNNKWYLVKTSSGDHIYKSTDWTKIFHEAGF